MICVCSEDLSLDVININQAADPSAPPRLPQILWIQADMETYLLP